MQEKESFIDGPTNHCKIALRVLFVVDFGFTFLLQHLHLPLVNVDLLVYREFLSTPLLFLALGFFVSHNFDFLAQIILPLNFLPVRISFQFLSQLFLDFQNFLQMVILKALFTLFLHLFMLSVNVIVGFFLVKFTHFRLLSLPQLFYFIALCGFRNFQSWRCSRSLSLFLCLVFYAFEGFIVEVGNVCCTYQGLLVQLTYGRRIAIERNWFPCFVEDLRIVCDLTIIVEASQIRLVLFYVIVLWVPLVGVNSFCVSNECWWSFPTAR